MISLNTKQIARIYNFQLIPVGLLILLALYFFRLQALSIGIILSAYLGSLGIAIFAKYQLLSTFFKKVEDANLRKPIIVYGIFLHTLSFLALTFVMVTLLGNFIPLNIKTNNYRTDYLVPLLFPFSVILLTALIVALWDMNSNKLRQRNIDKLTTGNIFGMYFKIEN